jgi:hypothetical protein
MANQIDYANFIQPVALVADTSMPASFPGAEIDEVTGALVVINVPHHEVHESEMFMASRKSPDGAPIADDANLDILFRVGAAVNAHTVMAIAAGGDAELSLYENPTVTLDGTPLARVNMDRSRVRIATSLAFHTPTIGAVGTLLFNFFSPGGTGGNSAGGTGIIARPGTEWILRAGVDYLLRSINRAGNAQPMSDLIQWYEEGV